MGPLIPLFWTSGDIHLGWQPYSCLAKVYVLLCMLCMCLRFTSGATPADLLVASLAAEPFFFHVPASKLWRGSKPGSCHGSQCDFNSSKHEESYVQNDKSAHSLNEKFEVACQTTQRSEIYKNFLPASRPWKL